MNLDESIVWRWRSEHYCVRCGFLNGWIDPEPNVVHICMNNRLWGLRQVGLDRIQ